MEIHEAFDDILKNGLFCQLSSKFYGGKVNRVELSEMQKMVSGLKARTL